MILKNKTKELAPLDLFLIYEIKEGQTQDFMTLQLRRPTLVNLRIPMVDKEVEGSDNQTIEEMINTN